MTLISKYFLIFYYYCLALIIFCAFYLTIQNNYLFIIFSLYLKILSFPPEIIYLLSELWNINYAVEEKNIVLWDKNA